MKNWKRKLLAITSIAAVIYLVACWYIWTRQVELIFLPMAKIYTNPERMGMKYEDVVIPVGQGNEKGELHGFWVPSGEPAAPTVLYFHGNDATIGKNLVHTQQMNQLGCNVLLIDYRGFGKTFGKTKPSERKVYEDAETAWEYLLNKKGFMPREIFIYGHSLGGAIAIELATRKPSAAGLIVESTFTSTLDMSGIRYNGLLRLLPINILLNQRFDSIDKIGRLKIPVLLIHGTEDDKIPFRMTEELYARANEPKEMLLISGARHANSGSVGRVEYRSTVNGFLKRHGIPAE